tara:strand:- start:431 stop:1000 length:570 start_codon:yes stop_codon:yes gene_type:complete
MNKDIKFLINYYNSLRELINFDNKNFKKIVEVKNIFKNLKKNNKKILIFGNGGSAAIASHFSVDLTKNARIKCTNYNESDLITCFSNDFGYEKWVEKAIEYYGERGDVLIAISASGNSPNMINGCKAARNKKFKSIITLTGFNGKNKLSKLGNVNFSVNSRSYNHIENTHQIILLSLVDLTIGKSVYKV